MARRYAEHEAVQSDITEIRDYIAKDNPVAAGAVVDAIYRTLEAICEHPERFPRYASSTLESTDLHRAVALPFRHYLVFYELTPDEIRILYVHHSARDFESRRGREKRT